MLLEKELPQPVPIVTTLPVASLVNEHVSVVGVGVTHVPPSFS